MTATLFVKFVVVGGGCTSELWRAAAEQLAGCANQVRFCVRMAPCEGMPAGSALQGVPCQECLAKWRKVIGREAVPVLNARRTRNPVDRPPSSYA